MKILALAIASFLVAAGAAAQSNNLYYVKGGAYYGRITATHGSHFTIAARDNTQVKTYANSCRNVNTGGVAGVYCTWGQFRNSDGRLIYSGDGYFFQNGLVYLRWLYELNGISSRNITSDWYIFRPGK